MAEGDVVIDDPRVLAALAHPARLAMLEHLQRRGPATATQCAEVAGISAAAASYHMRLLARYGLIEDTGGGNGRERPWRARLRGFAFESHSETSPAHQAAAALLLAQLVGRGDRWTQDFLARHSLLPVEWQRSTHIANKTLTLSPAEAERLAEEIDALCDRYRREAAPGGELYRVLVRSFPARVSEQ
jgi:DNA-binding transcriptional ArsR family regulator